MPSVCFSGFPLGSVVSINGVMTTSWGQMSEGDSIWDLEPTPGASVEINALRSALQVAPEAFNFSITTAGFTTNTLVDQSVYDASYHDKYVFWDYGDSYQFTAPEKVLAANLDSQFSRGPLGSHTYRAPGNYIVRVAVLEPASGSVAFGEYLIGGAGEDTPAVGDPAVTFAGNRTIFVDTNGAAGGYPNAPAGADTYDNLQAAANQMPGWPIRRVILERGQTHNFTNFKNMQVGGTQDGPTSMRFEAADGPGAAPIFQVSPSIGGLIMQDVLRQGSVPTAECDIVFSGLDIRGNWDSTTETGTAATFLLSMSTGSGYTLFDDCVVSGFGTLLQTQNTSRQIQYTLNDTVVTNWSDYAVLDGGNQSVAALTGSRIMQHVDALSGGPQGSPRHNTQGPTRFSRPNRVNVLSTDMFSRNGWFPQGSIYDIQPCLRFATAGDHPGARLNVGGCSLESGGIVLEIYNSENGSQDNPVNAVLDGNILVGGWRSVWHVRVGYGGTTWRNNFFVLPDVERDGSSIGAPALSTSPVFGFGTSGNGSAPGNYTTPTLIYNNTIVNLLSTANAAGGTGAAIPVSGAGSFTVTYENNLLHEPNRTSPRTLYGTAEVAPPDGTLQAVAVFTSRYNGYRDFGRVTTLATQFATPADSGQIWVPQIGSPALGAALAEPNAVTSFSGTRRPEPPSIGAAELE